MSQLFLSTSGTSPTVVIADLGNITFTHPVVSFELLLPSGIFTKEEIGESVDLQAAITAGFITIVDQQGASITDLSNQAAIDSYVKVTIDDTNPGTLADKLDITGNVIGTILNPGADETYQLNINPANPIDAANVAYDETGAPAGSPTDGTTNVQDAVDALNVATDSNTTGILNINNSLGQPNGIATLDATGVLPTAQLPALAITSVDVVADITARDALIPSLQEGDLVKVTDAGADVDVPAGESASYWFDGAAFVRVIDGGNVFSINGQTGVVVLDAGDIGYDETAAPVGSPTDGLTDTQAAIDALNVAVNTLNGDTHVPAIAGNDAISVVALTQAISLLLDTTTGGGDNTLAITPGLGLYNAPGASSDTGYFLAGLDRNQNASAFLRMNTEGDVTNQNPFRVGFPIEINRIDAFNRIGETDGWTAEIYINGVLNTSLNAIVPGGSEFISVVPVANVALVAGDQVSMRFVNTSGRINRPTVIVHYERV